MTYAVFMYYLCADSSGQTKIKYNSQDNGLYVVSGIVVHEKDWRAVEERLSSVKRNLFPEYSPNKWELHAHEIWHGTGFFAKEKANSSKRNEIFSKVVDAACKSEIVIISVVVFKDMLTQRRSPTVMRASWQRLTARFEGFLGQNQTRVNDGLFLIDSSQRTPETEIGNSILAEARRKNGRLGSRHVVESPIFVDSFRWNLIQLADMIAYTVHRHYMQRDAKFTRWFESMVPKMHHSDGKLYGFGMNEIPLTR